MRILSGRQLEPGDLLLFREEIITAISAFDVDVMEKDFFQIRFIFSLNKNTIEQRKNSKITNNKELTNINKFSHSSAKKK